MVSDEGDPLGANQGSVTIEVNGWDYVFSLVYGIVLLISLVGVAKYAIRA